MDAATLQQRIWSGYAKAAIRIGYTFAIYRSATAINPLDSGNLIGTTFCGIDKNYTYKNPAKYGDKQYQLLIDGTQVLPFDYLVGQDITATYFICSMFPLVPILGMACNHTITITRPTSVDGAGFTGYSAYLPGDATLLMQSIPASVLI